MKYSVFQDKKLSLLGFGTMRLPTLQDGSIDEPQVFEMVRYAAEHGINYYDTAYPYHNSMSEIVVGRALKQLPRDSFYLATKYPGHQISERYDPAEIFEEQLQKCGVEYFDFYLLHNVYENSLATYTDPQWGIVDYFVRQRELGRIRHLGFSTHAQPETLKKFLDYCGDKMEFCQIQLNYLDWTLQDAKAKYELLAQYNLPVWVMEPVRGGKLAVLDEASMQRLRRVRPDDSAVTWAFRFLMARSNVKMVLSGMSSMQQMVDNIHIFETADPIEPQEEALLLDVAEGMKNSVPCTACRYCCEGCPMQLNIPGLLSLYNDMLFAPNFNVGMAVDSLPEDKRPSACVACGNCAAICPQKIDIPAALADFAQRLQNIPHWEDMCRQRAEAAAKLRAQRAESIK